MSLTDLQYEDIDKKIRNTGFFSEYLPPCFRLDTKVFLHVPQENCDLIQPYSFNMSRFNQNDSRRIISIPEIGAYAITHLYMKETHIIKDLIELTDGNTCSFSPILDKNYRIVRHEEVYDGEVTTHADLSNYVSNLASKIIKSSGAKKILKLDISNFYSSFYIHMIPAIMLGVEEANNQYQHMRRREAVSDIYEKYRKLDSVYRRQNLERTNGLLVGPLSSRIIAEGMLTRIDRDLHNEELNYTRYVDDYDVYLYEDNEKQVISKFIKVLKKYGFSLNYEKIKIVDFPYYVAENLGKIFKKYRNSSDINIETSPSDLMDLFNTFFNLETAGIEGAVRYLLKCIEANPIRLEDEENQELYRAYLFTILANNDRSLVKACSLILKSAEQECLKEDEKQQIIKMLLMQLTEEHDLEVLWLLYLLLETQDPITMDTNVVDKIVQGKNELAQIMLLRKGVLTEEQKQLLAEKSTSWILAYELFCEGMLAEDEIASKLILDKNLVMYRKMKEKQIHFCY